LPIEDQDTFNKDVTTFMLKKALKEKDNKSLLLFCIDKSISMMFDKENLEIGMGWITSGKVIIEEQTLDVELTDD
jgi:hypothetical protein